MKFSVWSSFYVDLSPENMVLELERIGSSYTEFSDEHGKVLLKRGNAVEIGKRFAEYAASHGVSFPQGHLKLGSRICANGGKDVEELKDWLKLYCELGIKSCVLHCDFSSLPEDMSIEAKYKANIEAIKPLAEQLSGTDVSICLENLRSFVSSAEQLLYICDGVGGDNIGICLDTGHLNLAENKDQSLFIHTAGTKLRALHLADNNTTADQHLMPNSYGNVDFYTVFAALRDIGYDNLYNYEIPGERSCSLAVRAAKTAYLRQITDIYYAGR